MVAIVCGSPSSEMDAPWDDEVWVLGNRCQRYPRYDRIFEIHDNLDQHDEKYAQWLVDKNIPMVVGENFPIKADHVEVFPYMDAEELVGSTYLTSSSACMLAYALLKGHECVGLYGVDMAVDDHEYFWQRPCMEFWVGFAKGRGVDLYIPEQSPLAKSDYVEGRDYGSQRPEIPFQENDYTQMAKSHGDKIDEALARLNELDSYVKEAKALELSVTAHDGAKQVYERMAKVQRAVDSRQNIQNLTHTADIQ